MGDIIYCEAVSEALKKKMEMMILNRIHVLEKRYDA